MKQELVALRKDVDLMRADIAGLVEAWKAAGGLAKFVKWIASIATAAGVLYVMIKGGN